MRGENLVEMYNLIFGIRFTYQFPNGYGAIVIRPRFSYGGPSNLWEVGVLNRHGELCYETPVTNDVIGHLSESEVDEILRQIADLPVAE